MREIEELFQTIFKKTSWTIDKPAGGLRKEKYIVSDATTSYFIKFDINTEILVHIAGIGVTPKVLHTGECGGRTFAIQEFVAGSKPSKEWIRINEATVFNLIKKYHADPELKSLLAAFYPEQQRYENYLTNEVDRIDQRLRNLNDSRYKQASFRTSYKKFVSMKDEFMLSQLIPVHEEPNNSNFLLSGKRLYIVDWDDVRLGDPIHDIGPILWWYFPITDWEIHLERLGVELNDMLFRKVYWFAARSSLEASLFFSENGYDTDRGFLNDFIEAVHLRPNPRS